MSAYGYHPCGYYSCCENHGGQCFGDGCFRNPKTETDDGLELETETETENETEEDND